MDVVIRLGVRIEMHWPLFSIGTLQLNSSLWAAPLNYYRPMTLQGVVGWVRLVLGLGLALACVTVYGTFTAVVQLLHMYNFFGNLNCIQP